MKKYVITCSYCKNKMKITNKYAKYKCPNCGNIYKFTWFKKINLYFQNIFKRFFMSLKNIKNNIVTKYRNTKATYNYLKQMRANMKNNPNWSNYHSEQAREKKIRQAEKPSFWDRFEKLFKR